MLHIATAHLAAHHAASLLAAHHATLHGHQACRCDDWGATWCVAREVQQWLRMPTDTALKKIGASQTNHEQE
jgi:hypothetical protein